MTARTEFVEQCEVVQWFHYAYPSLRKALWATANGLHIAGTPRVRAMKWEKFKRQGGQAGSPDLVLTFPSGEKHGLYIEMKRAKASPSDTSAEQVAFAEMATANGYRAEICKGAAQAKAVLVDYLQPLQPRIAP